MQKQHSSFWADYTSAQLQVLIAACARPAATATADGDSGDSSSDSQPRLCDSSLTVVLPLGATEQHGPHLPLHTDTSIVQAVIAAALPHLHAAGTPVLFLPEQAVGLSPEHASFAGTLSLRPETCISLWSDIGRCVAGAGVRKLLLFNAHGGNAALMEVVARQLRVETGMFTAYSSWHNLPLGDAGAAFDAREWRYGIHAGAMETAIMQHLHPELVQNEQVQNFPSTSQWRTENTVLLGDGRSCRLGWAMQDYNPQGAAGDATQAGAHRGKALTEAAGASLAALLAEISALPLHSVMAHGTVSGGVTG